MNRRIYLGNPAGTPVRSPRRSPRLRGASPLQTRQEMLEKIFDHIPVMVALLDPRGRIQLVNREWERIHGWSLKELGHRDILKEIYPDQAYRRQVRDFIRAAGSCWREFRTRVSDGRVLNTCWCNIPLSDGSSIGIGLDITERTSARAALEKSERRFRLLIEHAQDIITILDAKGKILYDSPSLERLLGYKPDERIGRGAFGLVHPEDVPNLRRAYEEALRTGASTGRVEFRVRHRDGSWRVLEGLGTNLLAVEGIGGIVINSRDITDRKRAEEQLRVSHEELRRLSAHLESVRERERGNISREIHDELGQLLAALKMDLSRFPGGLEKREDWVPALSAGVEAMSELVDQIIDSVKKIAAKLRPPILDSLGLAAAIEWQCQQFSARSGIRCSIQRACGEVDLDRERSAAVFRIFQEILTNVARHARTRRVVIGIRCSPGSPRRLILRVRDYGKGIREAQVADPGSLGIRGMRERASLLGGKVEITGIPGKGTAVTVSIPLDARHPAA